MVRLEILNRLQSRVLANQLRFEGIEKRMKRLKTQLNRKLTLQMNLYDLESQLIK